MMFQMTLTNPAAAVPRQQTFYFSASEKRMWDELPVIRGDQLRSMVDELIDYDAYMMPDPYLIAVPVGLNMLPRVSGWYLGMLTDQETERVYPHARTGVVQRFAKQVIRSVPKQNRHSTAWFRDRTGYEEKCLPPWLVDRKVLDTLEKSIRTSLWEAMPEMKDHLDAERELLTASSKAFMHTGYYVFRDAFHLLPKKVVESSELSGLIDKAHDAMEVWGGTNLDMLVSHMMLPYSALEGSGDEPLLITGESADHKGFGAVPELGLSAEDVATISDHIDDLHYGGFSLRKRDGLPERCRPHFERLARFVDEAERRERLEIVEA